MVECNGSAHRMSSVSCAKRSERTDGRTDAVSSAIQQFVVAVISNFTSIGSSCEQRCVRTRVCDWPHFGVGERACALECDVAVDTNERLTSRKLHKRSVSIRSRRGKHTKMSNEKHKNAQKYGNKH